MSLLEIWKRSPEQLRDKRVQQLIAISGDGKLSDGGVGSSEFRAFLTQVSSDDLNRYSEDCLTAPFQDSGFALQDIVNELGSRLGATVTPGRYRGAAGQIGNDGLWVFPDSHGIVVEAKTTDAYRIDLNKVIAYKAALIQAQKVSPDRVSILIVVGREDTGDLEAQVRGSRFAWDIRIISVNALFRLLRIKEEVDDPEMISRIHKVLVPREFTRLDEIVDLVFSTAEDLRQEESETTPPLGPAESSADQPQFTPVAFHQKCIEQVEKALGRVFIKRSRSTFTTPEGDHAVVCMVSKEHDPDQRPNYWFAFYPHQKDLLQGAPHGYVALGCGSATRLLLIPASDFIAWLDGTWVTQKGERFYWHIVVYKEETRFVLHRKKGETRIEVTKYLLQHDSL